GQELTAGFGFSQNHVMKPSRLVLTQPISAAEGIIPGRFRDLKTNMQFSKMDVVPLGFYDGRAYWPNREELGKPTCKSINGVFPLISDELVRQDSGKGCKACPMSQWKKIGGK